MMSATLSEIKFDPCDLYDALWCAGLAHRPGGPLRLSAKLDELVIQVLVAFKPLEEA